MCVQFQYRGLRYGSVTEVQTVKARICGALAEEGLKAFEDPERPHSVLRVQVFLSV